MAAPAAGATPAPAAGATPAPAAGATPAPAAGATPAPPTPRQGCPPGSANSGCGSPSGSPVGGARGRLGLWAYACGAVAFRRWDPPPGESESEHPWYRMVYKIPQRVERFAAFGVLICIDDLLWCLAVLPLHILAAFWFSIAHLLLWPWRRRLPGLGANFTDELIQSLLLLASTCVFMQLHGLEYSMVYHWIRMEPLLKLYALFMMWEIFDKLLSSVGPDVIRSLAVSRLTTGHTCLRVLAGVSVTVLHAAVVLAQCATLDAALNSPGSFWSLLISNNFTELKISVFKSAQPRTLLQTACSDVVERFKYVIFVLVVLLHSPKGDFGGGLSTADVLLLFGMEMIVDWVKHFFIARHSTISWTAYDEFCYTLAQNVLSSSAPRSVGGAASTQWVAQRMGSYAFPVVVVLLRAGVRHALRAWWDHELGYLAAASLLVWVWLLLLKLLVNVLCVGWAARIDEARRLSEAASTPCHRSAAGPTPAPTPLMAPIGHPPLQPQRHPAQAHSPQRARAAAAPAPAELPAVGAPAAALPQACARPPLVSPLLAEASATPPAAPQSPQRPPLQALPQPRKGCVPPACAAPSAGGGGAAPLQSPGAAPLDAPPKRRRRRRSPPRTPSLRRAPAAAGAAAAAGDLPDVFEEGGAPPEPSADGSDAQRPGPAGSLAGTSEQVCPPSSAPGTPVDTLGDVNRFQMCGTQIPFT